LLCTYLIIIFGGLNHHALEALLFSPEISAIISVETLFIGFLNYKFV